MFEDDIFEEEFFPTCDIYVAENSDESDFDEDDIKMMEELERVSTMLLILITFQNHEIILESAISILYMNH